MTLLYSRHVCLRPRFIPGLHSFRVELELAGRPGDRWALLRKKDGREESPDTVVQTQQVETQVSACGARGQWATRLVTPGDRFFAPFAQAGGEAPATDSATENRPPAIRASVAGWRQTFSGPESDPRERIAEGDAAR